MKSNKNTNEDKRNSISSMIKTVIIIILLVIIIFLLYRGCKKDAPLPVNDPEGYITDDDIKYQEGSVKRNPPATTKEDNIALPVVADFTVSKHQPYANLFSPEENKDKFIIQYTFKDVKTNEILYQSDWLKGGFKYSVDFGNILPVGKYDVTVEVKTKDASSLEDKNGIHSKLVITVTE